MRPARYDFDMRQGSTITRTFRKTTAEYSLTQYDRVRMQIRTRPTAEPVWSSDDHPGALIMTADSITFVLSADITKNFDFNTAGYDIDLIKDATEGTDRIEDTAFTGTITLTKEYTKWPTQ